MLKNKFGKTRVELYSEHVENCEYCQVNKDLNCKEWRKTLSEAGKPKREFNLVMKNNNSCKDCAYWEEYPEEPFGIRGLCHRLPPFSSHDEISRQVTEYGFFGYQPITNHNDWCGEFRNKNYKNWLWNALNALGLGVFFYVALRLFLNV